MESQRGTAGIAQKFATTPGSIQLTISASPSISNSNGTTQWERLVFNHTPTLAPALNALKSSLNEALLPSTPRWESGLMRHRHAFLTQQDFHSTSITKWKASLHRSPPQPTGAHGPPWTSATPWIHLQLNWIMPVMAWLPNQAITSEHQP